MGDSAKRGAGPAFVAVEVALGALVGVIALAVAIVALQIDPAELGERRTFGGADQVLHYGIFASALETFPFFPNPGLGFPEAQNLFFAPLFDIWSAIFVWVAGFFVPNSVWALNLYNLGSFVAVGFTSYAFFRALRLRRTTAVVFGTLFATVQYHFLQLAFGHPFLSNYWAVPLAGILVLMVAGDRTNPFAGWIGRASNRAGILLRRILPIVVLAAAVAFTQSYYFVFGALLVGGVWFVAVVQALVAGRGRRRLFWPTVTTAVLFLFIGGQLLLLSQNFGDRYEQYFAARDFTSSENYGGKFIDLLLPAFQSGFPSLAAKTTDYRSLTTLIPMSESASTAIVASLAIILCFALLMVRLIAPLRAERSTAERSAAERSAAERSAGSEAPVEPGRPALSSLLTDARIGVLLVAFLGAFLFFITAGLGTVLGFLGSAEIRAWSRMAIVISMLALGVLAIVIERVARRTWLRLFVLLVVAVVAAIDQVPRIAETLPIAPVTDTALKSFTAEVDARLAPDCGVIILPLKGFPETGPIGDMGDYDEALPYVFAERGDLRWSYGAVAGTESADYYRNASTPEQFAALATQAGACAVVVDTFAYTETPDGWKPFVDALGDDPAAPAIVSTDTERRYLFFPVD